MALLSTRAVRNPTALYPLPQFQGFKKSELYQQGCLHRLWVRSPDGATIKGIYVSLSIGKSPPSLPSIGLGKLIGLVKALKQPCKGLNETTRPPFEGLMRPPYLKAWFKKAPLGSSYVFLRPS